MAMTRLRYLPAEAKHGGRTAITAGALTVTLGVAAACWAISINQMQGMNMGVATRLGSFAFFSASWISMMAAMMLPGATPAILRRTSASRRVFAAPVFALAYVAIWAMVGIVVYAFYRPHGTVAAGVVVITAGIYELTPIKRHFRRRCGENTRSGFGVRARLRRLEHRNHGDPGRGGRHERPLDGRARGGCGCPEGLARQGHHRGCGRCGDRRARHRDPGCPLVSPGTHTTEQSCANHVRKETTDERAQGRYT